MMKPCIDKGGETSDVDLWPVHTCTYAHTHTHSIHTFRETHCKAANLPCSDWPIICCYLLLALCLKDELRLKRAPSWHWYMGKNMSSRGNLCLQEGRMKSERITVSILITWWEETRRLDNNQKGQKAWCELEQTADNRDQRELGKGTEFSLWISRTPFLMIQYSRFYTYLKFWYFFCLVKTRGRKKYVGYTIKDSAAKS